MASLLRMSDEELAKQVAGQGFRVYGAALMATTATVLAFLGMASRQAQGEAALLPGGGSTSGQIGWAAALGLMMLGAAWLARNVVMKRLQAAIVVSLLLHLLICLMIQYWSVNLPVTSVTAASDGQSSALSELTVPDYGGMEAVDAPAPEWEEATESPVNDARVQEMERQLTEVEVSSEPERAEVERQQRVARLENMERREVDVQQREAAAEMQRRMSESAPSAENAQAEPAPELATRSASEAQLQDRAEARRAQNNPEMAERERTEIETQNEPRLTATRVESQRSETLPEQESFRTEGRRAKSAESAVTVADAVEVTTEEAAQATAREREMETARRAESELAPQRRRSQNTPRADRSMRVARVSPERRTVSDPSRNSMAPVAPVSSGAASQSRRAASASAALSGEAASAQSVEVAAAAGSQAPSLNASTSGAATARGSSASVPTSAARNGNAAPSRSGSRVAVNGLNSSAIGRQSSGSDGQPRLGRSVSSPLSGGAGRAAQQSGTPGGVGTKAGEVQVAAAGASRAAEKGVLSSGPASRSVQRSSGGLSGESLSRGRGMQGAAPGSTGSTGSTGRRVAVRSSGSAGLRGRGSTEPSARLGKNAGLAGGGDAGLPASRTAATASLPPGAVQAEQSGALVMAGPQAASSGGGRSSRSGGPSGSTGISGPRSTVGVGRRTASLPGTRRSKGSGIGRRRPSLPSSLSGNGGRGLSRSRGSDDARPSLASSSEIAGLVRRSARELGPVAGGKISPGFSMRRPNVRADAVRRLGGSDASEKAVERGLEWLASHQFAAGHWSIHELNCDGHECQGHGSFEADTAATGLALLAFLGAGHTHRSGDYQEVVGRGLEWLVEHQQESGDLFVGDSEFVWLYSHGMASIALCEAFGMTQDSSLRESAQKSLDFIVQAQHPEFGGWRYRPQFESDTSVSGWQLMALKSGQMAGLSVPRSAYAGVSRWLDTVESDAPGGRFSYHPSKPESLAMTAEGLLMRQYLGAGRDDPALVAGARYLKERLPRMEERDAYYWYYATQVMFHMQGDFWAEWNAGLRDLLIDSQEKGGSMAGSWSPESPSKSKWGQAGGRHYLTCLNLLMLEVYYRHLPLYIELEK